MSRSRCSDAKTPARAHREPRTHQLVGALAADDVIMTSFFGLTMLVPLLLLRLVRAAFARTGSLLSRGRRALRIELRATARAAGGGTLHLVGRWRAQAVGRGAPLEVVSIPGATGPERAPKVLLARGDLWKP